MFETYIERQKRLRGEKREVFLYDPIPAALRVQIIRIWRDAIGEPFVAGARTIAYDAYKEIHERIADEFGRDSLLGPQLDHYSSLTGYFEMVAKTEECLTIIEFAFNVIPTLQMVPDWFGAYDGTAISPEEANETLNARFLQHGMGYQLVGKNPCLLVRKDNELLHTEAVVPALSLLHDQAFKGADDEYRSAHDHYRHGRYDECLTDCLKAFESTMKTIIGRRKWDLPEKQTASALIKECLSKGLLGAFMEQHLSNFQAALSSGVPTVRNNLGAHGQGEEIREVPRFYAEYMIHETAVNIVLLVEAFKALQPLK